MKTPTHFDLDSAEKSIRANLHEVTAEAMRLAPSEEDKELVRLQGDLEDFMVAFALWDLRRRNNAGTRYDELAAQALGYTVGNMIASFVANSSDKCRAPRCDGHALPRGQRDVFRPTG